LRATKPLGRKPPFSYYHQTARKNLVHYYGALAPRSPLRPLLVAKAEKEADRAALREKIDKVKKKAGSWAACLARVFEVYPLVCPRCGLEPAV